MVTTRSHSTHTLRSRTVSYPLTQPGQRIRSNKLGYRQTKPYSRNNTKKANSIQVEVLVPSIVHTQSNTYQCARERLAPSSNPDSLPCRENEFNMIMGYVESAIKEQMGCCVYVSGVPGSGKTVTVNEVIRSLQKKVANGLLPPFEYAQLNGMKLTDPTQAYVHLWQAMTGEKVTASHACSLLEHTFNSNKENESMCVLMMDELDLLVTKNQRVMYNLFNWPSLPNSRLVVIAVANTMDLPERILTNRVSSRLGLNRVNFQPYAFQQLMIVVQSRLKGMGVFNKDAIEYAARKVSAVSGDARRALEICRRAVEIIESKKTLPEHSKSNAQVTINIIEQVVKEMSSSPTIAFVSNASIHQKIFLWSLLQRTRVTGLAEVELGEVIVQHNQMCRLHNIETLSANNLLKICSILASLMLIETNRNSIDIRTIIRLNISEEDLIMTFRNDAFFKNITV